MTVEQGDAIIALLQSIRDVFDWILFVMLLGFGLMLWRVLVLGKNSRNLWS